MRKGVKTGAAVLMLCAMGGNAMAAASSAGCARPEDMTALKAAAVQQRLMVAAFSCNAVQLYNKFVTSYRKELQASDRALQNYFRRQNGATGTEDYHAYKTKMANASSIESIGNITTYCATANAAFDAAFVQTKQSLKEFISAQTTAIDNVYSPCPILTAATAKAPKVPPAPASKPGDVVVPAQGSGLAAPN